MPQTIAPEISATDTRQVLMDSGWLSRHVSAYGWDDETQDRVCESISRTLRGIDWRFDRLHKIEQHNSFKLQQGDCVLDAGCGRGEWVLAGRHRGYNMVGVELDEGCMNASHAFADLLGLSTTEKETAIRRGDVTKLPFESNSFAVINCSQVLEHVDERVATVQELFRCLQPGGILSIDAPEYRGIFEAHYRIPWLPFLPLHLAHAWLDAFDKPHGGIGSFSYVTLPHIRGILEGIGFEILSATTSTPTENIESERLALWNIAKNATPHGEESVRDIATAVRRASIQASETSMILLARKPDDHSS